MKQSGFTLAEVTIGVSIIGLLAGITYRQTDAWDRFATRGAADQFISAHQKARTAAVRFGAVAEPNISGVGFDFMLSNPPYGKSWKSDLERMGGKKDMRDPRFMIEHAADPEYSLVTRSSDGQMLFLANKVSKMKQDTRLGSRIAEVHNGSALFTGDAGQGESNIRRWIIELYRRIH